MALPTPWAVLALVLSLAAAPVAAASAEPEATASSTVSSPRESLAGHGPVDTHQDKAPLHGRLRMIRYLEDYSDLSASEGSLLTVLKHVPLGGEAFASTGAQLRFRVEHLGSESLVERDAPPETLAFGRALLHVDVQPARWARVFVQLGSHFALGGRSSPDPTQASQMDLQQGFVELRAPVMGAKTTLRVGRQELALGSGRWVGVRDGTNVRQPFDLARLSVSAGPVLGDSFFGFVPRRDTGIFDDEVATDDWFFGSHWTLALLPNGAFGVDVAYLGRRRPQGRYRDASGREWRHTWATRIFGRPTPTTQIVLHALLQHGVVGETTILAHGLSGTVWQRLPGPLSSVEVGLRSDWLSGDRTLDDGRLGTFQPLFPNQTFFSALAAIFPTNLITLHPLLRAAWGPVSVEGGVTWFLRDAVEDHVYASPGQVLLDADASRARATSAQISVGLGWHVTENVAIELEYVRAEAGSSLAAAGGGDVDFFGTWTTVTY